MPDPIKESFKKVKEDMTNLSSWIQYLSNELQEIKRTLQELKDQTNQHKNPTDKQTIPTDAFHFKPLIPQKTEVSFGNKGVPTDRQTDQQTDRHIQKFVQRISSQGERLHSEELHSIARKPTTREELIIKTTNIETPSQILNSLDTLKKDLKQRFKKLTPQELNIFSLIYQLEDQGFIVDYPLLAQKTNLSQSSVRDYTLKLIGKGVPLDKKKENNKQITLSIPPDFKKIVSLDTILRLKEL